MKALKKIEEAKEEVYTTPFFHYYVGFDWVIPPKKEMRIMEVGTSRVVTCDLYTITAVLAGIKVAVKNGEIEKMVVSENTYRKLSEDRIIDCLMLPSTLTDYGLNHFIICTEPSDVIYDDELWMVDKNDELLSGLRRV